MKSNIYIPEKIRIGFQKRKDTFTGKLAYVICFDEKGKLRKETSWESWRDKSIQHIDLDNKPTEGFVFNKGVQRHGYFGSGRSIIRVHHPDDFEFEISIDNLVAILMNSDVSKRDIKGKFVFAWAGKDLILLPIDSMEYQQAMEFTNKQTNSIKAKDLKKGFTYSLKKSAKELTYLGYLNFNNGSVNISNFKEQFKGSKKHVFYDKNEIFVTPSVSTFSECINETVDSKYGVVYEKYEKSKYFKELNTIVLEEPKITRFGQVQNRRVFKDFGDEEIMSVIVDNHFDSEIYFNKQINKIIGVSFSFFKADKKGYTRLTIDPYRYLIEAEEDLQRFLKEFPELIKNRISHNEFFNLLKQKGFKSVYVKSDIEHGEKIRI